MSVVEYGGTSEKNYLIYPLTRKVNELYSKGIGSFLNISLFLSFQYFFFTKFGTTLVVTREKSKKNHAFENYYKVNFFLISLKFEKN